MTLVVLCTLSCGFRNSIRLQNKLFYTGSIELPWCGSQHLTHQRPTVIFLFLLPRQFIFWVVGSGAPTSPVTSFSPALLPCAHGRRDGLELDLLRRMGERPDGERPMCFALSGCPELRHRFLLDRRRRGRPARSAAMEASCRRWLRGPIGSISILVGSVAGGRWGLIPWPASRRRAFYSPSSAPSPPG
jgi:hypothetical protein